MSIVENKVLDCGWGKLLFGETYSKPDKSATDLKKERKRERNILFYPLDPQIILTHYPQDFFLNPAYTYKLDIQSFAVRRSARSTFSIRKADCIADFEELNDVYTKMKMQPLRNGWWEDMDDSITVYVVEDTSNSKILGGVMVIDHFIAYKDPKKSVSIWSLVVDSNAPYPGIGKALVKYVVQEYKRKKRERLFLSVVFSNIPAQKLYESLGFVRTPILTVKNKTPINESLFVSQNMVNQFSPQVKGIVREALKRGIHVEKVHGDVYILSLGGRELMCEESLSEMTSSLMQSTCINQHIFLHMLDTLNISYPQTRFVSQLRGAKEFLAEHERVILKTPFKQIISEDITTQKALKKHFSRIHSCSDEVLLQKFEEGDLYRILVMDGRVCTVVCSKPPEVVGDGKMTVRQLIKKQSRRKIAISGGESKVPLDSATRSYIGRQGYNLESVLPKGEILQVRKTANYHKGGTMIDMTDSFPPAFKKIATKISKKLGAAVLDIEMIIPDLEGEKYFVLEANTKPHLSYYASQNVYARFIDILFPRTK